MSEGLITRVRRLVTGGVYDIVESVENAAPETVMRESIREVDRATDEVRAALGQAIANRHHANKRLMETTSKHEELAEQARFALEQDRDDLAEAAIGRQMDVEAQIPVLESTLKSLAGEQAELEGYVSALVARKREMEADLEAFVATRNATSAHGNVDGSDAGAIAANKTEGRVNKAENAFNRVLQGASGLTATSRADVETATKLAELETIARDHRVKERLAALKAVKEAS